MRLSRESHRIPLGCLKVRFIWQLVRRLQVLHTSFSPQSGCSTHCDLNQIRNTSVWSKKTSIVPQNSQPKYFWTSSYHSLCMFMKFDVESMLFSIFVVSKVRYNPFGFFVCQCSTLCKMMIELCHFMTVLQIIECQLIIWFCMCFSCFGVQSILVSEKQGHTFKTWCSWTFETQITQYQSQRWAAKHSATAQCGKGRVLSSKRPSHQVV